MIRLVLLGLLIAATQCMQPTLPEPAGDSSTGMEERLKHIEREFDNKFQRLESELGAQLQSTRQEQADLHAKTKRLEAEMNSLRKENEILKNMTSSSLHSMNAMQESYFAFHAMLLRDRTFSGMGPVTPWLEAINRGNAFHGSTGSFNCSVGGLYFFAASAGTQSSDKVVSLNFWKSMGSAYSAALAREYSSYTTRISLQTVVYLNPGESVWLYSDVSNGEYYWGTTTFTGFLLVAGG